MLHFVEYEELPPFICRSLT